MPTPGKETHMSQNKPPGAGKSSFDLVDPQAVFQALGLTGSTVFLDLGCGPGEYLLAAARIIGPKGKLYGVDAWEEGVHRLRRKILGKGLQQCTGLAIGCDEKRAPARQLCGHLSYGHRAPRLRPGWRRTGCTPGDCAGAQTWRHLRNRRV